MSVLEAALRYASIGWPVIPLLPREKLPIGSLVPNGIVNATTDRKVILSWWETAPNANVGVSCEKILVVDVDPRNDGVETLEPIVKEHGNLICPRVRTGGGGYHFFFKMPPGEDLKGKLGKGIDLVHGRNRYIVGAPSVHPSGARYSWSSERGTPIALPPEWLLKMARRPPPAPLPPRSSGPDAVERARRYLEKVDPAVAGAGGHNHTFKVCCRVVELFDLSEADALGALEAWNAHNSPPWSDADLRRKLTHAVRKVTK